MKLYLVRHGESIANVDRRYCGQMDVDLTDNGLDHAMKMARKFEKISIEKIYSSPLIRAHKTANEIAKLKNISIINDDRLLERNFGDFEGLNWEDIEEKFPEEAKKCLEENIFYNYRNGESFEDILNRVESFMPNLPDNTVIVAHGMLIKTILFYFKFVNRENIFDYPIGNCDVLFIDGDKIEYVN